MTFIVLAGYGHSSPFRHWEKRASARIHDLISNHAVIEEGSPGTMIEGQPVARQGDSTSHGGTLIDGEPTWLAE